MALTVETGAGLTDADAYCSLEFADAYLAARGETLWATDTTESQREQAIRRATDYMQQVYRYRWAGYRKTQDQSLDWPRYEVPRLDVPSSYGYGLLPAFYPDNTVPAEVQRACAYLALKAAAGELAPDVARVTTREKIDVIEVEYAEGATPWVRFRAVDNLLAGLLKGDSGSTITLRRA
jgi:hypothetical protein